MSYFLIPTGIVLAFAGSSAPSGFLVCDGSAVSRTSYSELFSVIGTAHGSGDGSTTFNLPDYRGRFLRGCDNMGTGAAGLDPDTASRTAMNTGGNTGDAVGSVQSQATAINGLTLHDPQHSHPTPTFGTVASAGNAVEACSNSVGNTGSASTGITLTGDNETRPINAYVKYIIKA